MNHILILDQRIAAPVRTNQIPRQIPPPTKLLRLIPSLVIGGWMPAFATSIEMWYILDSLWTHQSYHVFGMLFLAYLVLIIVCSQVSVLLTYFSLCAEVGHNQFLHEITNLTLLLESSMVVAIILRDRSLWYLLVLTEYVLFPYSGASTYIC